MKKRVHEIAKQQGLTSKEVLAALKAAGIEAKVAASSVEEGDALKALAAAGGRRPRPRSRAAKTAQAAPSDAAKRGCAGRRRRRRWQAAAKQPALGGRPSPRRRRAGGERRRVASAVGW